MTIPYNATTSSIIEYIKENFDKQRNPNFSEISNTAFPPFARSLAKARGRPKAKGETTNIFTILFPLIGKKATLVRGPLGLWPSGQRPLCSRGPPLF
jgi:hypothetical protein